MEQKHKSRIKAEYRQAVDHKELHILDIPDDYQFMDPELIELLQEKTAPYLEA